MLTVLASDNKKIPVGAELFALNDRVIEDFLEFRFYHEPGADRRLTIGSNGTRKDVIVKAREPLDLKLSDPIYKRCANDCAFCFVNGLPRGLRRELYFRDDDYRLSFLFGNFLSLTNLSDHDRERIGRLRLSPLYVSVHATNPAVRRKIFGNEKAGLILEQLRDLADRKVKLHCQIVVLPGINDGGELVRSIRDLAKLYPSVNSIGIVPVGISRHLRGFAPIRRGPARTIVKLVQRFHNDFRKKLGTGLVYLADEFFIKAGQPCPAASYYDDFSQYENGIGMARRFLDEIDSLNRPRKIKGRFLALTGAAAFPLLYALRRKLTYIMGDQNFLFDVDRIENRFFGPAVTVAGLLAGRDLMAGVDRAGRKYDRIVLPPDCVNDRGEFLDGFLRRNDRRVLVAPGKIKEFLRCLQ
jgi:putative radical SAM enzyme (TIGR03279 family)